jgi:hypothetical protein
MSLGGPFPPACVLRNPGAVLAVFAMVATIAAQGAGATQLPGTAHAAPLVCTTGSNRPIGLPDRQNLGWQVTVGPDGVFRARLTGVAVGRSPGPLAGPQAQCGPLAGLRVRLLRQGKTVATTTTGRDGRFSLRNLPRGQYLVVVDGPGIVTPRPADRPGTSPSAPPPAPNRASLPIPGLLVRGQPPPVFPIMSLRQAAVITGLASGAIAAPVIYHNARLDNRLPASP